MQGTGQAPLPNVQHKASIPLSDNLAESTNPSNHVRAQHSIFSGPMTPTGHHTLLSSRRGISEHESKDNQSTRWSKHMRSREFKDIEKLYQRPQYGSKRSRAKELRAKPRFSASINEITSSAQSLAQARFESNLSFLQQLKEKA